MFCSSRLIRAALIGRIINYQGFSLPVWVLDPGQELGVGPVPSATSAVGGQEETAPERGDLEQIRKKNVHF